MRQYRLAGKIAKLFLWSVTHTAAAASGDNHSGEALLERSIWCGCHGFLIPKAMGEVHDYRQVFRESGLCERAGKTAFFWCNMPEISAAGRNSGIGIDPQTNPTVI